jgi:hypothetical protein
LQTTQAAIGCSSKKRISVGDRSCLDPLAHRLGGLLGKLGAVVRADAVFKATERGWP